MHQAGSTQSEVLPWNLVSEMEVKILQRGKAAGCIPRCLHKVRQALDEVQLKSLVLEGKAQSRKSSDFMPREVHLLTGYFFAFGLGLFLGT